MKFGGKCEDWETIRPRDDMKTEGRHKDWGTMSSNEV